MNESNFICLKSMKVKVFFFFFLEKYDFHLNGSSELGISQITGDGQRVHCLRGKKTWEEMIIWLDMQSSLVGNHNILKAFRNHNIILFLEKLTPFSNQMSLAKAKLYVSCWIWSLIPCTGIYRSNKMHYGSRSVKSKLILHETSCMNHQFSTYNDWFEVSSTLK